MNVTLFLPELACLLSAILLLLVALANVSYRALWRLSILAGVVVTAAAALSLGHSGDPFTPGFYRVDLFSQIVKLGLAAGLLVVLLLCGRPVQLRRAFRSELPFFLFVSTLGMMALSSATELLTFYVALEFSAYPIYIMAGFSHRKKTRGESPVKYILQGAIASAVALYGLSLIFGAARTTMFAELVARAPELATQPIFLVGLLLALSGVFFKLALAPFHFWAPDVYQDTPHPIVVFIATTSKLAAVAVLCRLMAFAGDDPTERLSTIVFALSALSMTLGNLAAMAQQDLKRLLAYSAIAHAGYIMVGLISLTPLGLGAALFYGLSYMLMGLACFVVVCAEGADGSNPTLQSIAGLHRRSPALALTLLVGMFGLAGIPPTVGFAGKWFLFSAALERGQFALVFIAAVNSTIALYYYLRVIRYAYLEEPTREPSHAPSRGLAIIGLAVSAAVILLGILPGSLWNAVLTAAQGL